MYTVFFISTCFGCYLHPSSGAQLPRTPKVGYLWKTEVLVSSGVEVYFVWICVYNDERNKEYSVHLVGPELYMYISKTYGTTNIKFSAVYVQP
jgi:hypothetical protein